jgi:hypothetical protein
MGPAWQFSEIPPKSSQRPSKFVLPIQRPPQYKINAVVRFKRQKLQNNHPADEEKNAASSSVPSSSSGNSSSTGSPGVGGRTSSSSQADAVGVNNLKEVYVGLQREQENLRRSHRLIKDEVASLNDIERSLTWLLKKARQYETLRGHLPPTTSG